MNTGRGVLTYRVIVCLPITGVHIFSEALDTSAMVSVVVILRTYHVVHAFVPDRLVPGVEVVGARGSGVKIVDPHRQYTHDVVRLSVWKPWRSQIAPRILNLAIHLVAGVELDVC